MKKTISSIVYGDSGDGKTCLALTAPKPLLMVDLEFGASPAHTVKDGEIHILETETWDLKGEVPDAEVIVCRPTTVEEIDVLRSYMLTNTKFKSLVFDSLTEMQTVVRRQVEGDEYQMRQQDWGFLYHDLERIITDFKYILNREQNALEVLLFTASVDDYSKKESPLLQGKLGKKLPALVDLLARVKIVETSEGEEMQIAAIKQTEEFSAKCRIPHLRMKYGNSIKSPNLQEIADSL